MFGKKTKLFEFFGFPVHVDASWFIIVALISWSLATQYFPFRHTGLTNTTYWAMGLGGALGLFVSILLHEFSHSFVARYFGIRIEGITLFIFGGVAEMKDEPQSAKVEFLVAIAGPLASVVIALSCASFAWLGPRLNVPVALTGVVSYLAVINGVLVGFNVIPAFPLDGGRVLRAILWQTSGNLKWATRITAGIGGGFGLLLIMLGALTVMGGHFVAGMWQFLIGMFLRGAAQMSYQQLLVRRALEGEHVQHFMHRDPVTVQRETTLEALVEHYVYQYQHKMFPVTENGRLVGCVSLADVRRVPRDAWATHTVEDVMQLCGEANTIKPDTDAVVALSTMSRSGSSRLLVTEGTDLKGIVTLKDLLKFIDLKVELEQADGGAN